MVTTLGMILIAQFFDKQYVYCQVHASPDSQNILQLNPFATSVTKKNLPFYVFAPNGYPISNIKKMTAIRKPSLVLNLRQSKNYCKNYFKYRGFIGCQRILRTMLQPTCTTRHYYSYFQADNCIKVTQNTTKRGCWFN